MRESFVFYRSFWEILELLDDPAEWQELLRGVFEYIFDEIEPDFDDPALQIAFTHFRISCDFAYARYEKAVEDGKQGGRPSKKVFIPPDVWIGEILKQGSIPKAAEALGLSKQTLYNWAKASDDPRLKKVQKSKNPSVSVSVSVSESEALAEADSEIDTKIITPCQTPAGPIGPPSVSAKRELRPAPLPIPTIKGDEGDDGSSCNS